MKNTPIFLNKHIFIFWDAQNPEKRKPCRHSRKEVGPKAPGAHRAHGPRPLGPMGAQLGGWGKLPTVRQIYLLSGKLPTVRQSYLLSGMHPTTAYFAPNNRIHAPNRSIDMHPKGIDMHPKVSIYFAPNFRILCTQPSHRHAPKRHRLCTQK